MSKKFLAVVGFFILFIFVAVLYLTSFNIHPTDEKIVDILLENEEDLLSIEGVVGAGIARDEDNHIIGIAVYVEDEVPISQQIPDKMGEFQVSIQRVSEASETEKENMVITNHRYQLLNVVTDKGVYHQNQNIHITIKNQGTQTVTFGNSAYDLFFKRWNGVSWEFYTAVIGAEVLTHLHPQETGNIEYQPGDRQINPFPQEDSG